MAVNSVRHGFLSNYVGWSGFLSLFHNNLCTWLIFFSVMIQCSRYELLCFLL